MSHQVRPAAVAGSFYAADPTVLDRTVADLLALVPAMLGPAPKVLIVPHAGYIYSGPIAAQAYRRLQAVRDHIKRVVLLGPAHRVAVRGLALPTGDGFATPLGMVTIDREACATLSDLPQVVVSGPAHALEHALEVQLPFLQKVLGEFALVPLVVGHASAEEVAAVIDRLWGGAETLIVISSDLSHYLPYATAQTIDLETVGMIMRLQTGISHQQACGATPINGMLVAARRHGVQLELLDLRNSGDTAGDRSQVVGYCAILGSIKPQAVIDKGPVLLGIARASIAAELRQAAEPQPHDSWLQEPGATFVTLTQGGELRGCIGSLTAERSLREDVKSNALAAAFRDPRFSPLSAAELPHTRVEVSLLSASVPLSCRDENDALAQLRPGIDGVILEYRRHRSTFLPQVWEQLPEPRAFLARLKQKAGLAADFWAPELRLARYTVIKWKEPEAKVLH